jgi:hypothetical protein
MQNPFRGQKAFWTAARRRSMGEGIIFLAMATVAQILLGHYSSRVAAGAGYAHDIFLDNLPVWNLDFLIVSGAILLWALAWWLMMTSARELIFGTKAIALYIIVRAFFTTLTHIGAYPIGAVPGPENFGWDFYRTLTFPGNFFFSGHTAFPFLMALIFWDKRPWRNFFFVMAVLFGATMLLAHQHYSIDVFAAPFIVYGTYRMAEILFPKDRALMEEAAVSDKR